ncbi:MAG: peptide chain release factor N(5)-glutamine methyltransferase [Sphingorhabdus sp.]
MSSPAHCLRNTANLLAGVSDTPRLDAELLMAHALGISRSELLLGQMDLTVPKDFQALVDRRMANEPIAYITGKQAFWDLDLEVNSDVLIPRADSETLIEMALESFQATSGPARILDLGTGSGALLLAALSVFPNAKGIGVDASADALAVARVNTRQLGLGDRANLVHASWHDPDLIDRLGTFDLILCNPPYVEDDAILAPMVAEHEPHSALFAGPYGLDEYQVLIPILPLLLAPGGYAIFEIGHRQVDAVTNLARTSGFSTEIRNDLNGNPRSLRFSLGIVSAGR